MNRPSEIADNAAGSILVWHIAASLILTALADWLFFRHPLGWTIGAYGGVLLAILLIIPSPRSHSRIVLLLSLLTLSLCLRCVYEPNLLSEMHILLGLITVALVHREEWSTDAWIWLRRITHFCLNGPVQVVGQIGRALFANMTIALSDRKLAAFGVWLIPFLCGVVFLSLFALANPVISLTIDTLWQQLTNCSITFPAPPHVVFWVAGITAIMTLLQHVTGIAKACKPANVPFLTPLLSQAIILRALIVFNLIFAIQTGLDIYYLWGGATLPEGMTYAKYAHRGAYVLIFTALLSGGFAVVAFRTGIDRKTLLFERKLVYLWLAQNVFLVISSAWRLWLYVGAYSLTRLRVAAAVWMLLVIFGLLWIIARIVADKSDRWLLNVNAFTAISVLYLCAWTGADSHIAQFNVRHCAEVLGREHREVDVDYLRELGPDTLPALNWLCTRYPENDNAPKWHAVIADLARELHEDLRDWRDWTLNRARLGNEYPANDEDRFSFGKVVSVSRFVITVREYDFAQDKDIESTYYATPETEYGNIASLTELKKNDDVVMDFMIIHGRRVVSTIVREISEPKSTLPQVPDIPPANSMHTPNSTRTPDVSASCVITGRVVALRPGRINIRQPGEIPGTFTNQDYAIAHRAKLWGLSALTDLKTDQRVIFRSIIDAKPTIIELATHGFP